MLAAYSIPMTRLLLFLLAFLPASIAGAALVNFARSGTATASSEGFGSIAADGNDGNRNGTFGNGSVFHSLNETGPSWWQVVLPAARTIDHIRIFNRSDAVQGSAANFRLIASRNGTEVFNQIFLPSTATDSNNSRAWGTSALRGITADTIRIQRVSNSTPAINFLTFAELEIWGADTTADPLITPATVTASPAGAGTAISDATDGDINGNYNAPGIPVYRSSTGGIGRFWEADLGTDMRISSLLLFNRTDSPDTSNLRVSLLNTTGATLWTRDLPFALGTATPFNYGFELEPGIGARKVRIETTTAEILTLAEIQIFGTPLVVLPPVVDTRPVTAIGATGAETGAALLSTGFAPTIVRLYHGPADGGTNPAAWASMTPLGTQTATGNYSLALTGLPVASPYFVRAYAENSGGGDWADSTLTFSTLAVTAPALTLSPPASTTGFTALINGTITSTGNDPPRVRLYWGSTDGGTNPAAWAFSSDLGVRTGGFGQFLSDLQPSTPYHLRASAANAAGTSWTPATITFTTSSKSAVVINEIHYEPADPTKNSEFVELWNPSTSPQNLSGCRLDGPVQFLFPQGTSLAPGGFLVIAGNSATFQSVFGFAPAGQWSGRLKNSGDRLLLRDAALQSIDDVDYAPGFPWPTSASGAGPSIELINPGLENDSGGSWRSSTAAAPRQQSPGAANTVFAQTAPPSVSNVRHLPVTPAAAQDVVVSAKIEDLTGVASASLSYQSVNPGTYIRRTDPAYATSWSSLPMNDSGTNGDTTAGDGIWSVTIPATVQVHRRLVRYRITAQDAAAATITVPYADDEQPNFAYFTYNGTPAWNGALVPGTAGPRGTVNAFSPAVLDTIPPWHLIATETDVISCQYNSASDGVRFTGTIVYDGKVYDHIQFKNRGIGSTYVSGKNKWAFYFNRARNIRVRDNWGRYYDQSWNSMTMDAAASPWCAVHRGMAGVEEVISYRIYDLCGVPALRTHYVHWRVIDNAAESGPTQFDGDFWGLYTGMEPYEGNFLDERNLPDGNIYSIEGYGPDQKHQSESQPINGADWNAFASATLQAGQSEAWYRANLDIPAFTTFQALNRYVANVDIRGGDNYRAYHRPAAPFSDNRWVIMPYDQDMMCLPAHHWAATIDGTVWPGVSNQWAAVTRRPAIAIDFRNRCRELLDLIASDPAPNGGQMAQLIDEYAQMVNPSGLALTWADADAAMWNMHPRSAGTVGTANGYTNHRSNFYRATFGDQRGSPMNSVTNWTRRLPDPDNDGFGDFEGSMAYLTDFTTNTWPGGTWARSNGNPKGYGYKFLEWESLYGGLGINPSTPDTSFPARPVITYTGPAGYPAAALDFQSSPFTPAPNGTVFSGMQWRIGEIGAPGIPGYLPGTPRKYEIEPVWTSPVLTAFSPSVRIPLASVRPGSTYRARVRHLDANGRWSRWSQAIQFTAGVPDVSIYQQSLAISEVNYNPAPLTAAEIADGFTDAGLFEWIEVKNTSSLPLDMSGIRFTKGADFDFPQGWTIPAGSFALVVKDLNAFRRRWGTSRDPLIAGTFLSGSLANNGEEIKLSYGAGTEVIAFTYSDRDPWPDAADGSGSSLALRAPDAHPDHSQPANWRASAQPGGSPGTDDLFSYSSWATAFPGLTSPSADDDSDGFSNQLEYAFLSNPLAPGAPQLPSGTLENLTVDGTTAPWLTIRFTRRADASDLTFIPESSSDLSSWSPATVLLSRQLHPDGSATETWRAATPATQSQRLFIRVRIP